jgi:hypothetical protein
MQYWLLGAESCPSPWTFFGGGAGEASGCYLNSPMTAYSPVTIADLCDLTLIGEAGIQGMDVVALYTEPGGGTGAQIDASGQDSVLGLEDYWNTAEFNVFGAGNGTQAIFNSDTTIVVQVSISDGTTNAPTCTRGGSTAETNSLTLMPEVPGPTCLPFYGETAAGSPLPSIEFLESNYGPEADSVTALPPSSVTGSSAVLNGEINPIGTEALAWFEYSTYSTPRCNSPQNFTTGYTLPSTAPFNGSGTDLAPFSAQIGGLSPGTTYYFWACSLGALYQTNSNVESFVTTPLPPQTITFAALMSEALSAPPFTVSATASSGLPVSLMSETIPVCTISGSTVTLVALGTCTIHATQDGSADYAAATPVNRSFLVTPYGQTITFAALPNEPIGTAPFTVNATASSGLAVSFASITSAVCTVSGSTVTLVTVGICAIQATQWGNTTYAAATPVYRSFHVQATQTITFGALANQPLSTPPFTISATASSGLTVKFYSQTPGKCTVSGATVTLVAVGTCTLEATQPGNADYAAAAPVLESFQVTQ